MRCVALSLSASAYPPTTCCPVLPTWLITWYLRQKKLKKLKKYILCTWYVAYVAYAREKFWNMPSVHGMYTYVHCLISEQANKTGRFRIVR